MFRPRQLQRVILGQAGSQRFFNAGGRGFCCYTVIGSFANRSELAITASELIGSVEIGS